MNKVKLLEIFFEECEENIRAIEEAGLALEARPDDPEPCCAIFRAVHTIKGGAASFDLSAMASFGHLLEDMLDGLRKGRVAVTKERIDIILDSADCFKKLLAEKRTGSTVDPSLVPRLVRRIETGGREAACAGAQDRTGLSLAPFDNRFSAVYRPNPLCLSRHEDPLRALEKLSRQIKVLSLTARCDNLPPLDRFSPDICYFWWEMEGTSSFPEELTLRNLASVVEGSVQVQGRSSVDIATATDSKALQLTDQPPSLLGSILMKEGLVNEEQLSHALARQTPCVPLGEMLVGDGVITAPQLDEALAKQRSAVRRDDASVRITSSKLDRLMDLTGELAIVSTHLAQISSAPRPPDMTGLRDTLESLERNTRDLQDTAMSIRMLPLGNIFSRFPRMVRDMAAASGKKATLVASGDSTELDKGLIEKLADSLTHLIRNAVDHGIEPPDVREAAGKPGAATIKLKAYEDAGGVVITVEDDGKGLDRAAILKKAISTGLIDASANVSEMSDQQVHALIFEPGFSTADTVTEVSGRGVGLDVVKKGVEAVGGTAGVFTRPGVFTRFVLRLPMTLAIMDGQLVRVGDERFIIPMASIAETLRPLASDVKLIEGQGEIFFWRGECLPFLRLYEVLDGEAWEPSVEGALVVIVEQEGRRKALMVDDLLEQQQVVIKGLGKNLPRVPGIAGAAILGDGKVVLILDVSTIDEMTHQRGR